LKPSQACAILLRTALIFLPMVLTALPIASAQQPNKLAPGSSLSISAKNVGSATSTSYHWATSWGSYDRDYFTQQDVELEAHNLSSVPAKIVVDFYFVGQPEHQAEPRKLFSKRTFDVDVPPGYQKRVSLRSDVLKSNETRYVMLGEQYNSGYHITGWLLQASVPNEATPFASVSSNRAWIERMDWFAPALAQFRAELPRDRSESRHQMRSPTPVPSKPAAQPDQTPPRASIKPSSLATPSNSTIILTSDVAVKLAYGQMTLRKGTILIVVSRTQDFVSVRCGNEVIEIPVTDTRPN
jgi:hypothetical protein